MGQKGRDRGTPTTTKEKGEPGKPIGEEDHEGNMPDNSFLRDILGELQEDMEDK